MGELWVSHDELVDAIGDDGADLLCRAVGGVSTYIPRKPVAGSPLSAVLGMKRMERLCAAFGGLRVTLPNRRKGEPFKDRIVRMLETAGTYRPRTRRNGTLRAHPRPEGKRTAQAAGAAQVVVTYNYWMIEVKSKLRGYEQH